MRCTACIRTACARAPDPAPVAAAAPAGRSPIVDAMVAQLAHRCPLGVSLADPVSAGAVCAAHRRTPECPDSLESRGPECLDSRAFARARHARRRAACSSGLTLIRVPRDSRGGDGRSKEGYGRQRLWGSVAWAVMTLSVGYLMDVYGTDAMFFCTVLAKRHAHAHTM